MNELKNDLERAARHYAPPRDSLERLERRRDDGNRNEKIGALVLGLAIVAALIFTFVTLGLHRDAVQPAGGGNGATRPVNGEIMYAKRVDNGWSLFTFDPETGIEHQITHGYRDYGSDWSPDGTQIVYDSEVKGSGASNIVVANADGSSPVVIANEGSMPAWSPDGTRIVFARADIGNMVSFGDGSGGTPFYLYVMNSDGSDVRRLTRGERSDYSPVWSPEGTQIAFERVGEGLFVMNSDGSAVTRLTDPGLEILSAPDWSPDGTSIAIAVNGKEGGKPGGVLLVPAGGAGTPTLIPGTEANYPDYVSNPAWSPDGQWIAYTRGYPGEVVIMHPDGSGKHVLHPDPGQDSLEDLTWGPAPLRVAAEESPAPSSTEPGGQLLVSAVWKEGGGLASIDPSTGDRTAVPIEGAYKADWSPDRSQIVYDQDDSSWPDGPIVVVANADGSDARTVAGGAYPDWSPNGSRVAFMVAGGGLGIVNPDGSDERKISADGAEPRWSPDGKTLAYRTSGSIMLWTPAGTTVLAQTPGISSGPEWSPDGSRIVYARATPEVSELMVVDVATGGRQPIPGTVETGDSYVDDPVWSPDGNWIAFHRGQPGGPAGESIVLIRPDGSGDRTLVSGLEYVNSLNWVVPAG